ncbi:MAG: hypothetical protein ACREVM_02595 [Burkholderiales bacterium]
MTSMLKQTALFETFRQMGVRFESFHGWAVPARFRSLEEEVRAMREGVGLADWSWMTKFDLKGPGLETPPPLGEQARCWQLGACHYLVTCEPVASEVTSERIRSLDQQAAVYGADVTSVFADFRLAGPKSRDVLSKVTSLDVSETVLPDLACAQSPLASVHCTLLRQDLSVAPAFHLLVSRDWAESVWHALLEAGEEFGMSLFGSEAWALIET